MEGKELALANSGQAVTEAARFSFNDIMKMGEVMAKSKLFGMQTADQAVALMLIAQAEGRHPASAAQDYNIIQNKPALKSEAALRRFQASGGKVEWKVRNDNTVSAIFTHKQSGPVAIEWTMERARKMGYAEKDNWRKQPMVMLSWRVVAEGVRLCYPACLGGLYLVEEVMDFTGPAAPVETPAKVEQVDTATGEVIDQTPPAEEPEITYRHTILEYKARAAKKGKAEEKELNMVIDSFLRDVAGKDFGDCTEAECAELCTAINAHYAGKKK